MNAHDWAMIALAAWSGVNTMTLILLAFRGGRWTGTVDSRLTALERRLDG